MKAPHSRDVPGFAARLPIALAFACAALATAGAQQPAANASAPRASSGATGTDADVGARIASQGVPNVAACSGCHGANGEGNAAASFPRIAGQSTGYLLRELEAYANGARTNPVMTPIAKALDDAQRRAVAAHYAGLETRTGNATSTAPAPAKAGATTKPATPTKGAANASSGRGAQLARVGDEGARVQACANCHGPGGIGQAPDYPYLAGQVPGYLQSALAEWKSGARKTDPSGQMPLIAQRLADADVQALVAFYSGLPPPPARSRDVASAWQPPKAVTVVSGPKGAGSSGAQGVGSEQGAGTTAGSQGPGGAGGTPQGNRSGSVSPGN